MAIGTLTFPSSVSCAWISSSTTLRSKRPDSSLHSYWHVEQGDQNVLVDTFTMGNDDGTDLTNTQEQQSNAFDIRIPEPRLLAVDVISVAIAAHLMTFCDVMSDPLQFVPPNPSPLPSLMERDSVLTVCWILSAISVNGYQQETVASDLDVVKSTIRIATGFTVLRVLLGIFVAFLSAHNVDAWETARQCYVTSITVGALRFFYGQYNR